MNDTLSFEDRRDVRRSLIATLAAVFALLLGTFALAGVNPPAAEETAPSISAAPAAPAAAPPGADTNEMVGCGCAEGCKG